MRVIIQRVSQASVTINGLAKKSIGPGLVVLFGVEEIDDIEEVQWLVQKICNLRIFDDEQGVMNLSVKDVDGEVMVISQFTLFASTKKGNRPSYMRSAKPNVAIPFYELFLEKMEQEIGEIIASGEFGADMKVALINEGPVTIIIDTKNKE
ncbi:MAG: D-tyrosyl-tRNA(Tyr) deacylase [Bacteroidetes bacterium]|nr:D-tyrosyl-tRNA(Tyr) deacylase [Bacteroidota bacterium]